MIANQPEQNVIIFLTNRCNNECSYCFMNGSPKNNSQITVEQIKEIIERYKSIQVKYVSLGGGEPTIHPDIKEICQLLFDNNWHMQFHTNGNDYDFIEWLVNLYKDSFLNLLIHQSYNDELCEKDVSLNAKIRDFVRTYKNMLDCSNITFRLEYIIEDYENQSDVYVALADEINQICNDVKLEFLPLMKHGRSTKGITVDPLKIRANFSTVFYTSDGECFENIFDSWKHELELSDDGTPVSKNII